MKRRGAWVILALAGLLLASNGAAPAAQKTDATPGLDPQEALRASQVAIGQLVGDYVFTDRGGRRVRLSSYRGKPLVVSFVYTGCYQVCPATTRFLAKAVRTAQDSLGRDSFAVITIGFNLPFDTPAAMAAFARQQGVELPNWEFLSPDPQSLEALTRDFGFRYVQTPKGFDHLLQATVVDQDGRIHAQVYGDAFDIPQLVEPLRRLLIDGPKPSTTLFDLVERVRLLCTVYDPVSATYRLNYQILYKLFGALFATALTVGFIVYEWRRGRGTKPPQV
jgi:protein SCO1/2